MLRTYSLIEFQNNQLTLSFLKRSSKDHSVPLQELMMMRQHAQFHGINRTVAENISPMIISLSCENVNKENVQQ